MMSPDSVEIGNNEALGPQVHLGIAKGNGIYQQVAENLVALGTRGWNAVIDVCFYPPDKPYFLKDVLLSYLSFCSTPR